VDEGPCAQQGGLARLLPALLERPVYGEEGLEARVRLDLLALVLCQQVAFLDQLPLILVDACGARGVAPVWL
jgi:hypothetical protein